VRADVRVAVDWAAKRVEAYAPQPFGLFATAKCLDQIAVAVLDVGDPSLGPLARAMRADSVALRVIDDAQSREARLALDLILHLVLPSERRQASRSRPEEWE
jgi:hypothetical protein